MAKPIPPLGAIAPYDTWHLTKKGEDGKPIRSASYKRRRRWRGAYQDGIRFAPYTKSFDTSREAQDWAETQVTAIRHTGLHVTRDKAKITLREWMPEWLKLQDVSRSSLNTYQAICNTIARHDIANLAVSAILEHHVKRFMQQLKTEGKKYSTRLDIFKQLSRIMAEAIEAELRVKQPCTRKAKPVLLKDEALEDLDEDDDEDSRWMPSTEQVWAFYDALDNKLLFWLGAGLGLRAKEACGALVETFDWEKSTYKLTQQWAERRDRDDPEDVFQPPKSRGSRRRFKVDEFVRDEVRKELDGRTSGLIVTHYDQTLTYSTLNRMVRRAAEAAGLPTGRDGMHFHCLRHWYVSTLIAGGVDVVELCARVRHSKADVTYGVYAHELAQPRGNYTLGEELVRGRNARKREAIGLRVV